MKKIAAMFLCVLLVIASIPLPIAYAGDPGQSYMFFLPKGTINSETMKLRTEEVSYCNFIFNLKQIAPPVGRVTPDGEVQVPFIIGIKIFDNYLDGSTPTRRLFDDSEAELFKSDITYMENSILYITLDALRPLKGFDTKDSTSPGLRWWLYSINMEYNANGYSVVPDLSITLPESADYAIDEAHSVPGLLYAQVSEGKALPADANLQFTIGEKNIRKVEKAGWYTYGKSKRYLPVEDLTALEKFPTLKNACHITYQFADKKEKIVHYGVLRGQWPTQTP